MGIHQQSRYMLPCFLTSDRSLSQQASKCTVPLFPFFCFQERDNETLHTLSVHSIVPRWAVSSCPSLLLPQIFAFPWPPRRAGSESFISFRATIYNTLLLDPVWLVQTPEQSTEYIAALVTYISTLVNSEYKSI